MFHWLESLIAHYGYGVILLGVFFNNLCFPIPGDMTLVGGGLLAAEGVFSFWVVVGTGTVACFLGGDAAYWLGFKFGRRFLKRIPWLQANPERIVKFERFSERHGAKVVFFARFVALLHPVTGLLAGVWKTPLRPFLFYNLAGSFAYAFAYTLAGYFFSQTWEAFKSWLGPLALYVFLVVLGLLLLALFLRHSIRDFIGSFSHKK